MKLTVNGLHLLFFYGGLLSGWLIKALVFTQRKPPRWYD